MKSSILILVLLFALLLMPVVHAEDALEWYTKAQNAATVGDYSTAIAYYDRALALDKNYASAYAGRAAALNMAGRYGEAVASADSALAIKSMDPVALNARALGLYGLKRYEESAGAYDNLFLVEQNRKEAYCNQAYAYLVLSKTENAIASYDRCTKLDPLNIDSWNNQGLALMQAKNYEGALQSYNRATEITIKNATIWNNKGVALMALGKPMDALQCFNKALGIDPGYVDAQKNKADAMGKQQSFTIEGTVTPTVTISRIGTFYTTAPPSAAPTTALAQTPEDVTTGPEATTEPVAKKTTYAPLSPFTVPGALAMVAGVAALIRRERR